jgi:DNA polymerase elongation subunit (family B)
MSKNKTKILYLDIENSPNLSYTWGKYDQDVIDFKQEWYIMSFAYKWDGEKVRVAALPDYKAYKKDRTDDAELVEDLWHLLDEADVVIGHNVDRFDLRKINTRFLAHGLTLPSSYKTVDTLKVARKMFLMNSNKLDHLAKYLGLGEKVHTGGFSLWLECMGGDMKAWAKMKLYNQHDVTLTEKVYKKLLPFITNHPNTNLYNGTTHNCPSCGSSKVQKRGHSVTRVGKRDRFQCQSCGSWSQGEIIKTEVALR